MKYRWQSETLRIISDLTNKAQRSDLPKTELDQRVKLESGSSETEGDGASQASSNIGENSDSDRYEDEKGDSEE